MIVMLDLYNLFFMFFHRNQIMNNIDNAHNIARLFL